MTRTLHPGETPEERRARRYAQSHAWAKANPDKTRAYGRKHYRKNIEKRRANSRAYYHAHKEARAAYSRAYYQRKRQEDPAYIARQNELRRVRRAMSVTPPTLYRRTYEALVRDCRRHLNLYIFTAMERARTACGDRVELYFARYPFEEVAERAIRRRLAACGIYPGFAEYDDCYDAGMLAYLYTMHRCAVLECDYVIPYLMKMIRINIRCARIVYRDSHNLCAINDLREVRIDAEGMQRRI